MMQMMTGGQFPPGPLPTEFNLSPPGNPGPVTSLDNGLNPEAMEPPPEPAEPNPRFLFNCCVCKDFSCDSLEILSQHLTVDRSRSRSEEEVSVVIAGNKFMAMEFYILNIFLNKVDKCSHYKSKMISAPIERNFSESFFHVMIATKMFFLN